jgi:acyl-CoA dehydrogenase
VTEKADALLLETAERVFAETCTHDAVERAEADRFAPDVWSAVADIGLPWIGVPESAGGMGGELVDALGVLRVAGRHAAPIPLAETGLLAGWLLADAGLAVGEGPATVVPGRAGDSVAMVDGRLVGTAHGVAWAGAVARIVVLVADGRAWQVAVVDPSAVRIEARRNLAGEPRDTVHFDGVAPLEAAPSTVGPDLLEARGALSRVVLMAGALEAMSRLTVGYTAERRQFGQAVARFQLVQEHLVRLAEDAVLVGLAADAATAAAAAGPATFEIAAAKALASRAATTATKAAHQAHGAMGMTREYPLHQLSRRLWSWRDEYGDDRRWHRRVGELAVAAGPDRLFPLVADGSAALGDRSG